MTGARPDRLGVSDEADSPEMEDLTIPQLISFLQPLFRSSSFETVERILKSREESLKARIEMNFSEELILKEVERIELVARCEGLERESTALRDAVADLERYLKEEKEKYALLAAKLEDPEKERLVLHDEMENYKNACGNLEEEIACLKEDYNIMCGKALFLESQNEKKEAKKKLVELEEYAAHDEIDEWKRKCKQLEARVLRLEEEKGNKLSCESSKNRNGEDCGSQIRTPPLPELEVGSHGNEDLPAQASQEPVLGGIIEISDNEDDIYVGSIAHKGFKMTQIDQENVCTVEDEVSSSSSKDLLSTFTHKRRCISTVVTSDSEDEDDSHQIMQINQNNAGVVEGDDNICGKNFLSTLTPKRKSVSRIVTSDSEEDDDDRIPLSKLKLRKIADVMEGDEVANTSSVNDIQEDVTPSRRRLVPLRECDKAKDGARATSPRDSIPQNLSPTETDKTITRNRAKVCRRLEFSGTESAEENEVHGGKMVDVESESEGESLGGFIVDDTEGPERDSSSNNAFEEEQSDGDVDLDGVLAKLRRGKDTKKWEYEADMLSSFSNDPELCMKAVCALYRQQTCEEKSVKGTIVNNKRGFSTFDAKKGSWMAEFLTDGDPYGPLKKTVQELKEHDRRGIEYCFRLATHYSKQLFMIYQNKEDPFFLPS